MSNIEQDIGVPGPLVFDNDIAIVGTTIDIGGCDDTSFHVDIDGNLWLGACLFVDAPFKIESDGTVIFDFPAAVGFNTIYRLDGLDVVLADVTTVSYTGGSGNALRFIAIDGTGTDTGSLIFDATGAIAIDADDIVTIASTATVDIRGNELGSRPQTIVLSAASWPSWTPTIISGPTGTFQYAIFKQIGNVIHFQVQLNVTAVGAGNLFWSLPGTHPVNVRTTNAFVGTGWVFDASAGVQVNVFSITSAGGALGAVYSPTSVTAALVSSAAPFAFANGDIVYLQGTYEMQP